MRRRFGVPLGRVSELSICFYFRKVTLRRCPC